MRRTVAGAVKACVAIGAHPGYDDREHFGRRAMVLPLDEVTELVRRQVAALDAVAAAAGTRLQHVKPHGALYNQAGRDAPLAAAVVACVAAVSPEFLLFALPGSALADAARAAGIAVCREGFADRRYRDDGSLMPRNEPGSLIAEVEIAVEQALGLATAGTADTICVHGDGPLALAILRDLRPRLEAAGSGVRAPLR